MEAVKYVCRVHHEIKKFQDEAWTLARERTINGCAAAQSAHLVPPPLMERISYYQNYIYFISNSFNNQMTF